MKELPGFKAQLLTFGLMIGFLILISSIILGIFMYIITLQKKSIFGVMKVQGISNFYISISVIIQSLFVSFIGTILGLTFTIISESLLPETVPFKSNYLFYLIVTSLIIFISILSSIFLVISIRKVDPLEVIS